MYYEDKERVSLRLINILVLHITNLIAVSIDIFLSLTAFNSFNRSDWLSDLPIVGDGDGEADERMIMKFHICCCCCYQHYKNG